MSACRYSACCRKEACICPPGPRGPAGPAGDINWGNSAYLYAGASAVTLTTADGFTDLGAGFWVSLTCVATSWRNVYREAQGVRVIIAQTGAAPLVLDGVVSFAVLTSGIAFITVNPALYDGTSFTPAVLPIAGNAAVGETIFTLANGFATGTLRNVAYGDAGDYVVDVLADTLNTPPGAAFIRASDYAIVGMAQYTVISGTSAYTGGVHGALLSAAVVWASQTPVSGTAPVTVVRFLPGPVTLPALRGTVALGQITATASPGVTVATVMPTRVVNPAISAFGAPAEGAIVYDTLMCKSDTAFSGTWSIGTQSLAFGTTDDPLGQQVTTTVVGVTNASFNVGYARDSAPFVDIRDYGSLQPLAMDPVHGYAELSTDYAASFRISGTTTLGNDPVHVASNIYVSALGLVAFETTDRPLDVTDVYAAAVAALAADPESGAGPSLYAAPFASADFLLPIDGSYDADAGLPGNALAVYTRLVDGNVLYIQWEGYAQSTSDPVKFQIALTLAPGADPVTDEPSDPTSGQVRFSYGVTSGSWAGKPWLTSTALTAHPNLEQSGGIQTIRVNSMPLIDDTLYFGLASYTNNLEMPRSTRSTARAVGPTLDARSKDGGGQGTIVVNVPGTQTGTYALARYYWPGQNLPVTVGKVNNTTVGKTGRNVNALPIALLATNASATDLVPVPVTVSTIIQGTSTPTPMLAGDVQTMLSSARAFGYPGTTSVIGTQTLRFTPAAGAVYSSALMTVPAVDVLQRNIASVTGGVEMGLLVENSLAIVQLAATNSTGLVTSFTNAADETAIIVWLINNVVYWVTRNGFGGNDINNGDAPWSATGVVPFTLTYVFPTPCTPVCLTREGSSCAPPIERINALVVGRPPRAGNEPANNPSPLGEDAILASVRVQVVDVQLAAMLQVTAIDTTHAYAITTTSTRALDRPYIE